MATPVTAKDHRRTLLNDLLIAVDAVVDNWPGIDDSKQEYALIPNKNIQQLRDAMLKIKQQLFTG